jgi:aminomethyltransferase
MSKQTPLYQEHLNLGAKMIDFGGWILPVQYKGIATEHLACRKSAAIFDVSHMGEILIEGKDASIFLNQILTNNIKKISPKQAQYTIACTENGGCVDDLIVYKISDEKYFLCVNAANTDKDFKWFQTQAEKLKFNVNIKNLSDDYAQIAIQGKNAVHILQKLTSLDLSKIKTYWFDEGEVLNTKSFIARTGYTGEDGFEIYFSKDKASKIWNTLLEEGKKYDLEPAGLGARDTLRTEMKYALYGNEISETLNPIEAGLGWVCDLEKDNFIGKTALLNFKQNPNKKLVGLIALDQAIARHGYLVFINEKEVGFVTSGTLSPSLNKPIAIAYVPLSHSKIGSIVDIKIRDKFYKYQVVPTPFYKGEKK